MVFLELGILLVVGVLVMVLKMKSLVDVLWAVWFLDYLYTGCRKIQVLVELMAEDDVDNLVHHIDMY